MRMSDLHAEHNDWRAAARLAMELEAQAIQAAAVRLNHNLGLATATILAATGKVVLIGMGKSGYIAENLAATLRSTGTPAVFLHPSEAGHGDIGICQSGDVAVLISKSGSTAELLDLVAPLRGFGLPLLGILGNLSSPLARQMDVVLDASVQKEADPQGFTPTASIVVALSVGHALVIALMTARGITAEQFQRYHPAGQLGLNLRVRVRDVMHSGSDVAWVRPNDSLKHVVIEMSHRPLGAACVIGIGNDGNDQHLLGLVTDGDVRRALQTYDDIRDLHAAQVLTASPTTIGPDALLHDALRLMEDRPSQISVLPVVDADSGRCLGLIRVHDIYHSLGTEVTD